MLFRVSSCFIHLEEARELAWEHFSFQNCERSGSPCLGAMLRLTLVLFRNTLTACSQPFLFCRLPMSVRSRNAITLTHT